MKRVTATVQNERELHAFRALSPIVIMGILASFMITNLNFLKWNKIT